MSGGGCNMLSPENVRDALAVFRSTAESGRLAHGYIISSSRMEWGSALAAQVAQWLFCEQEAAARPCGQCRACVLVQSRGHPDTVWVEPEMKSRVIGIEQVRAVNHFLRQTSFEGGWKVAVLSHAHRLSENAANAFLKTLEEPPSQCLMLLVTDSPQSLLPTILSRCQYLPVGDQGGQASASKVEQAMLEWLQRRTGKESPLEQSGWISAILREVRSAAEAEEEERATDETEEEVVAARVQARVVGARIEVLRTLYQWERDVLACAGGISPDRLYYPGALEALRRQAGRGTLAERLQRLDRVEKARRLLEGNLPENAVWEAVLPV